MVSLLCTCCCPPPNSQMAKCWVVVPHLTMQGDCTTQARCVLKVTCHILDLMLYHPVSPHTTVNGEYVVLLQDKMWPDLHQKKKQNFWNHGIILFQDNAALHCHHYAQSLLWAWGWEVLDLPSHSLGLFPCDYFLSAWVQEPLWDIHLNMKMPSIKLSPLCHQSRWLQHCDCLPLQWEKHFNHGSDIEQGRDACMLWHVSIDLLCLYHVLITYLKLLKCISYNTYVVLTVTEIKEQFLKIFKQSSYKKM